MMKRLSILSILLACVLASKAEVVDLNTARQKALSLVNQRSLTGKRHALQQGLEALQLAESCSAFYIFNVGKDDGYVVVSGDDRMPDVLGYSDKGRFDSNDIPCNMREWLKGYAREYDYLKNHPEAETVTLGSADREPISPLLECHWGQWAPYNLLCPENCPTGCVATAMAQVMYYYQWPKQTTDMIPSYTYLGVENPAIEITAIDWDHILPVYDANASETSQLAVATLMKLIGTSVEMEYQPDASGSNLYKASKALVNYFGYEDDLEWVSRTKIGVSSDTWNDLIYDELKEGRPVLYSGGITYEGGSHVFVVDGYEGDDYFHINWGWQGRSDGAFLLSALKVLDYDFTPSQIAVIRVQPTSTGRKAYMVIDNDTQTYYYDTNRESNNGISIHSSIDKSQITKVVIDPSFADYKIFSSLNCFSSKKNLTTIEGLQYLNTTFWTSMNRMFQNCSLLTSLDLSSFNTSNVTDMRWMFYGCSGLTSLDLSSFDTSKVTTMQNMFLGCSGLTSLDLSSFNTSNVKSMSAMFYQCTGLTTIYASEDWSTENVPEGTHLFSNCVKLVGGQGTTFDPSNIDITFARIDGGMSAPGYLTYKKNTSGLFPVYQEQTNGLWFSLSGLRFSSPPSLKGIYIRNGRKIVIK